MKQELQAILEFTFREGDSYTPFLCIVKGIGGLRDIEHIMSMILDSGNVFLDINSVSDFINSSLRNLSQNAADAIKECDCYFITKRSKPFLQNETVLLQSVTAITKYDDCNTKCDFYYKMYHYILPP